jgi:tetratricopeptide (TPR) repeat protein
VAAAYIRLGRHAEADTILTAIRKADEQRYEPVSNYAVSLRNQGRFAESLPLFELALVLHPEGHLGLGNWTLRAVRWQASVATDPTFAEQENFLGEKRASFEDSLPVQENAGSRAWDLLPPDQQEQLRKLNLLLRNYYVFADGYFTLGDELVKIGDHHLALYAYVRALDLQHPCESLVNKRILFAAGRTARWGVPLQTVTKNNQDVLGDILSHVREELLKCSSWRDQFFTLENEAVLQGKFPSFEETQQRLKDKKIVPYMPFTDEDRRSAIYSLWIEGIDLVQKKRWQAAEKVLTRAVTQAEAVMPQTGDHARLLMVYAASLSPQGGEKNLRSALVLLNKAEQYLRLEKNSDVESLNMVLGNLALLYETVGETQMVKQVNERRAALPRDP